MFLLSFISRFFPFLPTLDLSLSFSSANFERITVNQLDTSGADVARSRMNLVSVSYLCTPYRGFRSIGWNNVPKCFTGCFQRMGFNFSWKK